MTVIHMKPLSLAEVHELTEKHEEKKAVHDYLKKFCKLDIHKAKELTEELKNLNNVKIKEEYLIKVADFLPRDAEEVHKILNDVSLDEQETNAILEIVKNY